MSRPWAVLVVHNRALTDKGVPHFVIKSFDDLIAAQNNWFCRAHQYRG